MDVLRWVIVALGILFFIFLAWGALTGKVTNSKRRTLDDLDIPKKKLPRRSERKPK